MAELQELLTDSLRDLYDAEKQLTKALPKLAKATSNGELKQAFTDHLEVTQNQITRLEQAFEHLGEKAKSKPCKAMKGLVEEGQEHIQEHEKGTLRDLALAGAADKVEHYEISAYKSVRALAKTVGLRAVAGLMQETLREEEQTDNLLLKIAERLQRDMRETGASSKPSSNASRNASAGRKTTESAASMAMTDHDEIRQWAEARGAKPACVKGTGKGGDTGMIRLDFPGYSGAESLQPISWDDWFQKFDEQDLALLHQEKTAGGQKSNFNKLISRGTAKGGSTSTGAAKSRKAARR
jgi:ferritin-like metal-binding protein YciE